MGVLKMDKVLASNILNSERVEEIFSDCLCQGWDNLNNCLAVQGITQSVFFHPEKIKKYKIQIEEMLDHLPDTFRGRHGTSFLSACYDKSGIQWTESKVSMEHLFQLGIAIERIQLLGQRQAWRIFPESSPYCIIIQ